MKNSEYVFSRNYVGDNTNFCVIGKPGEVPWMASPGRTPTDQLVQYPKHAFLLSGFVEMPSLKSFSFELKIEG